MARTMPDAGKAKPATATTAGLVQVGSYRIRQPLGSGGMSSVFRAEHAETGHEVALKVLPRTLAKNATLLQRFLREAKSAEALEHPNIVAIFDRGSEDGRYYLVLEYVPGGDLHDRVRERGALPVAEAVKVIRGVAEGLRHAQARGLIHRDIKPANILLAADGTPKVADLGLAVQLDEEDERVTRDGTTVGTVDYMSPEQARDSRATSVRSDIYSLGCTFYHILAGSPPFAGGDVPDKLRRHAREAPPDIRRVRPDVPEPISRLIQRMMAKRPEKRPRDYDELIAELDHIALAPADGEALYALIDDDEDDDALEAGLPVATPGSTAEAATIPPRPGSSSALPPKPRSRPAPPPEPEVNLAALAGLDEDEPPAARRGWSRPAPAPVPPPALLDDETIPLAGVRPVAPRRSDDADLREWILRGLMIGVAIVIVGAIIVQLMNYQYGTSPPPPEAEPTEAPPEAEDFGQIHRTVTPRPRPKPAAPAVVEPIVAWVEPEEPAIPEPPSEPPLPIGAATPEWVRNEPVIDGPSVIVRRVADDDAAGVARTVERALETIGGTVEFQDHGPFFVSELKLGSRSRRVRSGNGYRTTILLSAPAESSADRSALVDLAGLDVVLEGLDLVVPSGELPASIMSVFSCRGGSLTLRDCTISLTGPPERPMTVFRLSAPERPEGAPPRLRLERSGIRGQAATIVEFADGAGRAWISGTAAFCGQAPAVVVDRLDPLATPHSRELAVLRSVIAGRRPFLEIRNTPGGPGATDVAAVDTQVAGSTLARVQGGGPCPLVATRGGPARSVVEWSGETNFYRGWAAWLAPDAAAGSGAGAMSVADLAAAQALWGTESGSREAADAWTDPHLIAWSAADLEARAPEALATLRRVAWPGPRVLPETVGSFARLDPPAARPSADRMVQFDVADPRYRGDLGRFLAAQNLHGVSVLGVAIQGRGEYPLTPVRMPEGVGLIVAPAAGQAGPGPTWKAGEGSGDRPLIEVSHAPLVLEGVTVRDSGGRSGGDCVRVVEGALWMSRCVLRHSGTASQRGAALVRFVATSTRPLSAASSPGSPAGPLPAAVIQDSVLIGGERALVAEIGCGLVALRNTAVAADGIALELLPVKVASDRFRADLQLDRCTLAAGRGLVALGAWTGSDRGPSRPWLVSSESTVFLDGFDHAGEAYRDRSVLLLADAGAIARGVLAWQSQGDTLDVVHFLGESGAALPSNSRPDVSRDWVDLWGEAHVARVAGPGRGSAPVLVRLHGGAKVRPGLVKPGDLALESTGIRRGRKPEVGADLLWLAARAAPPPTQPTPAPKPRPRTIIPRRNITPL